MNKYLLLLVFLVLPLYAQEYYRSNSLGMELEKIKSDPIDIPTTGWILQKTIKGLTTELVLYDQGKEDSSFIRRYNKNGVLVSSVRKKNEIMVEELFYRDDGQIQEDISYNSEGEAAEKKIYRYGDNGIPQMVEIRQNGDITSILYYSLRSDGSLRSIKTEDKLDELSSITSFNKFRTARYMEEQQNGNVRVVRFNSDDGRLLKLIRYIGEDSVLEETRQYRDNGSLEKDLIENFALNSYTIQTMNEYGLIVKEEIYKEDQWVEQTVFTYLSKKMVKKERKTKGFKESWIYKYSGDLLTEEEYYEKNVLESIKSYDQEKQGNYIISLYDSGRIFMKVYYVDDKKTLEEFIEDGKVTKTNERDNF